MQDLSNDPFAANPVTKRQDASFPIDGPPHRSPYASLGGQPTISLDVPITSVFLVLFLLGAVTHMTIFVRNKKRGHKFILSGLMFGFCMARTTTCIMRIAWATRPNNIRIAIAASILVTAGVVLLFVVNLVFAQRIVRAAHPYTGWHPHFSASFVGLYVLIVLTLCILISFGVLGFYTIDPNILRLTRGLQLYGGTLFALMALLPILLVVGSLIVPRKTQLEKFGSGTFRTKIGILLFAAFLLCLAACFRVGTNYLPPRSLSEPAWYHSKACFYVYNFAMEVIVIWLYAVVRVDKRFYVPNGSKGPGDYSRVAEKKEENRTEMI